MPRWWHGRVPRPGFAVTAQVLDRELDVVSTAISMVASGGALTRAARRAALRRDSSWARPGSLARSAGVQVTPLWSADDDDGVGLSVEEDRDDGPVTHPCSSSRTTKPSDASWRGTFAGWASRSSRPLPLRRRPKRSSGTTARAGHPRPQPAGRHGLGPAPRTCHGRGRLAARDHRQRPDHQPASARRIRRRGLPAQAVRARDACGRRCERTARSMRRRQLTP